MQKTLGDAFSEMEGARTKMTRFVSLATDFGTALAAKEGTGGTEVCLYSENKALATALPGTKVTGGFGPAGAIFIATESFVTR